VKDLKALPKGLLWVFCRDLPKNLTESELSDWLYSIGLDIPESNISVKENKYDQSALVAVPREVLVMLLNWAINGGAIGGHQVGFEALKNS
jgi:hypothetical protein